MENIRRIYLIRHAESAHNASNNRLSGSTDVDITETGVAQCMATRQITDNLGIGRVYTSSLKRAIKSAKLIFPNRAIGVKDSLREFNYGEYEGMDAQAQKEDAVIQQWNKAPGNLTFPGGDNTLEFAQNFYNTILEMVKDTPERHFALVSHRTAIRLFVARIIHLDLDHFRGLPCSNCGVTEVRFTEESKFNLHSLNFVAYQYS